MITGICAGCFLAGCSGPPPAKAAAIRRFPTQRETAERLFWIKERARTSKILSEADRTELVSDVYNPVPAVSVDATLVMLIAAENGAFPWSRYQSILELKAVDASPNVAWVYVDMYPRTKATPLPANYKALRSELRDIQERESGAGGPTAVSPREASFCQRVLSDPSPVVRDLALPLFVSKYHADRATVDGMLNVIDHELKARADDDGQYLMFVRRVIEKRNPGGGQQLSR